MTKRIRTKGSKRLRRYPKKRFPVYDQTYDLKMNRSPILNAEARRKDIRNAGALYDENACRNTLLQLEGIPDKDYHYLDDDEWKVALIPNAITNLRKIHSRFKQWQRKQVKEGRALEKPTEWPTELLEKRLKAEAILDICKREKIVVENALERYKKEQEEKRKKKILEFGPQGKGLNHDLKSARPWLIDGQKVGRKDDIPFINEPSSKYHQMPLVYYRKMASAWRDYQRKKSSSWRKLRASADELPEWPEDAKPITELELKPT